MSVDLTFHSDYELIAGSPQPRLPEIEFPFNVFSSGRDQPPLPPTLDATTVRWGASQESLTPRWKAQSDRLLSRAQSLTFFAGVLLGLSGTSLVGGFQLFASYAQEGR